MQMEFLVDILSVAVYVRGVSENSGGHAWVIDGYKQRITNVTYYHREPQYNIYIEKIGYGDYYYHCNWGGAKITTAMFGVLISSVHIMERVLTLIKIILCIKPAN